MSEINRSIAEFIDPERRRVGWWDWKCPECGHSCYQKNQLMCRCLDCLCEWEISGAPQPVAIPAFDRDDLAAFTHLFPVLMELGCEIDSSKSGGTDVWLADDRTSAGDDADARLHYAAALSAAFTWAMTHKPEELRKACEVAE